MKHKSPASRLQGETSVRPSEKPQVRVDPETSPSSVLLPILYVKSGCPWCEEVVEFLKEHGIGYREKNVSEDLTALQEMTRKSGQGKAPTLDWHGNILADFGLEELKPFLQGQNVKLEDS
jgi:glutaredoxin 3